MHWMESVLKSVVCMACLCTLESRCTLDSMYYDAVGMGEKDHGVQISDVSSLDMYYVWFNILPWYLTRNWIEQDKDAVLTLSLFCFLTVRILRKSLNQKVIFKSYWIEQGKDTILASTLSCLIIIGILRKM